MKCPKCGMVNGINDRVCRRCKWFPEEDRYVRTDPRTPELAQDLLAERRAKGRPLWLILGCAIVPGIGHVLAKKPWTGLIYCGVVVALFTAGLFFYVNMTGRMMLGLAASVHAHSIFVLTPWGQSSDTSRRLLAMGGILALVLCLYWPVARNMSFALSRAGIIRYAPGDGEGRGTREIGVPQEGTITLNDVLSLALVFIGTVGAAWWLGRRLSRRMEG